MSDFDPFAPIDATDHDAALAAVDALRDCVFARDAEIARLRAQICRLTDGTAIESDHLCHHDERHVGDLATIAELRDEVTRLRAELAQAREGHLVLSAEDAAKVGDLLADPTAGPTPAMTALFARADKDRAREVPGCGFSTSTWPGGECPMCGGAMADQRQHAERDATRAEFAALAASLPELPTSALAASEWPVAERRPVAGWIKLAPGRYTLDVGMLRLAVYPPRPDREVRGWAVEIDDVEITHGFVPTDAGEIAAQLAAEDALATVRDEIAAVLR